MHKQVVEVESEEVVGEKRIYRSFLFGNKRETIIKEAKPAKYAVKTINNPNYEPPKPVYTPRYSQCPATTCCDGTCSYSTGRGTCSWHDGVCD